MKTRNVGQKTLPTRSRQRLQMSIEKWSQTLHWPLDKVMQRLTMLALLPLYCWRLGCVQGLATLYRLLTGADCIVARHDRDPGTMIRADEHDIRVFQQIFLFGSYRHLSNRAAVRVIIDAGAYVGYSSIDLAERYPHAFIYALEPDERRFQALLRNTRHYPNIKAIQAAVWSEDGYLEASEPEPPQSWFPPLESSRRRAPAIPTLSMESLMAQYRISQIDILKIDIAGGESAVFAAPTCHNWLPRVRLLTIELHDHSHPGSEHNFLQALDRYDCSVVYAGEQIILDFRDPAKLTFRP